MLSKSILFLLLVGPCLARFTVNGPVITVTVKDPDSASTEPSKWLDVGAMRPNALWSVQSKEPPLPNWFPGLKSLRTSIRYDHTDSPTRPSQVEAYARFSKDGIGELQVQPSFHTRSKATTCILQAITRGERLSLLTKVNFRRKIVEFIKGSAMVDLPFPNSISALKITPSFDFLRKSPSCTMEGVTGSGRTKAVLDLNWKDPTLTVVHALDARYVCVS